MSDIIWSINPENDTLEQLLVRMKTFVNEVFEAKETVVNWQIPEHVDDVKLSMPKRKNFYLLFKEAVTNASKYSCAKNIFIGLSIQGKTLSLHIKDDGVGFNRAQVRLGNGLKNIEQRAAILNGTASIETCPDGGTAVFLQFPCEG
jgi:signal transduction histidine kinase